MHTTNIVRQFRDVGGTLLTAIIISYTVLDRGLLATLPITLLLAFSLYFVGYKIWWMLSTTLIVYFIISATEATDINIFILFNSIIEICAAYLLGVCIKKFNENYRKTKYIILFLFSIIFATLSIMMHSSIYGTPLEHFTAKNNAMIYINETYNGDLEISGVHYNSILNEHIVNVINKKDRRDEGSDDYHYRIEKSQSELINKMFKVMLNQNINISIEEMSSHVTLPKNKYLTKDIYSGVETIGISLTIKPHAPDTYFVSKEAFSKEAFNILNTFKKLGFTYESIDIESFLADGNTFYSISIEDPIELYSYETVVSQTKEIVEKK
ncbi:hypothetical protein [Cytobacillus sp. IB215316]|uniref:hypothetical protein n=1 Tax=Cytobacillus sp. IB215316 TaxID=3097354 RepID=UPI002A144ED3|nr:hypothetical protein [Cytobacillus sp. IB215316]MDX8361947.1 hypothetical protein [Cytobacillus sp. IB215316]